MRGESSNGIITGRQLRSSLLACSLSFRARFQRRLSFSYLHGDPVTRPVRQCQVGLSRRGLSNRGMEMRRAGSPAKAIFVKRAAGRSEMGDNANDDEGERRVIVIVTLLLVLFCSCNA